MKISDIEASPSGLEDEKYSKKNIISENDLIDEKIGIGETGDKNDQAEAETENSGNTEANDSSTESKDSITKLDDVLDSEVAISLMDSIIPSAFVLLIRFVGYNLKKEYIQLSAKEKKALVPAMNKLLSSVKLDFSNPYINFAVVLGIVYGSKIIDSIPNFEKITNKKDESNSVKFEKEYNKLVDEIMRERNLSERSAKKYIKLNMKQTISELKNKFGITEEEEEEEENIL
jgi:hypothetical protein